MKEEVWSAIPFDLVPSPMTTNILKPATIPSVQHIADGVPRFSVPVLFEDTEAEIAASVEAHGGVEAEIRAFLDSQLETGDVLVDLNPGYGFVALSATTAPGGMPTVLVAGLSAERLGALRDAAADAGGWIDPVDASDRDTLLSAIDARLEPEGRVFVHAVAANIPWLCAVLGDLIESGRVLAICVSDAFESPDWPEASAALASSHMTPCMLVEQEGDAVIIPCRGIPTAPVIALPDALTAPSDPSAVEVAAPDPVAAADPAPSENPSDVPISHAHVLRPDGRWSPTRDGFSLIAPHSRTGYGVAGAHLLRALQQGGVPVTFFPIGPIDRTITENPDIATAVQGQGTFRNDTPSVRLSQQFDLALHVGHGRHVAYTIFELDRFTNRERHHLQQQDAILVCSNWARQVCLDNGITDRPVHVVPLGVDRAVFHEGVPATPGPETVFLQVGKLEARKGQRELLSAFEAAFTPKDPVRLVLACANPFISRTELDALLSPFRRSPMASRITVHTTELPSLRDVAALMATADCGVFPVRAEGWNLEALEMLSMGKTIIASNCTAHIEYMTRDNARLISIDRFEPVAANPDAGRWAAWGASQHEQLVAHLRDVHTTRQQGKLGRNEAGIRTAEYYSWSHAADSLLHALHAIV